MKAGRKVGWMAAVGCILAASILAGCRQTAAGAEEPEATLYTIHASFVQMEEEQTVLTSKEALGQFSETHDGIAESEEFQNEVGKLGEEFFEENILLCAAVPGGSGAERYQTEGLSYAADGTLQMNVTKTTEGTGIAEMSQWYLLAAVPRDGLKSIPDTFSVVVGE